MSGCAPSVGIKTTGTLPDGTFPAFACASAFNASTSANDTVCVPLFSKNRIVTALEVHDVLNVPNISQIAA